MSTEISLLGYYPYRTAMVCNHKLVLPRVLCKHLEEELYMLADVDMKDNHTVFSFRDANRIVTHVLFSDFKAYFGAEIVAENW